MLTALAKRLAIAINNLVDRCLNNWEAALRALASGHKPLAVRLCEVDSKSFIKSVLLHVSKLVKLYLLLIFDHRDCCAFF